MIFESVPCSEVFCITADVMIDKDLLCRPNDQSVMAQVLTLRRRYRLGRLGRSEVRVGTFDSEIFYLHLGQYWPKTKLEIRSNSLI